jgi:hypothetical protein
MRSTQSTSTDGTSRSVARSSTAHLIVWVAGGRFRTTAPGLGRERPRSFELLGSSLLEATGLGLLDGLEKGNLTRRRAMTQRDVVWSGVFLLMLGLIGCERRSNEIEYRGERIKLTKAYADYATYKNDPENIHPSETERVQRLVLGAPIARTFSSRVEAAKGIGQIAFPGYASGGFVEQTQADGSVLMGFSVEVPRANKERYFVFRGKDGEYTLVDEFVHPDTAGLLGSVNRRGNDLVFTSIDGKEALVRPYAAK